MNNIKNIFIKVINLNRDWWAFEAMQGNAFFIL